MNKNEQQQKNACGYLIYPLPVFTESVYSSSLQHVGTWQAAE